MQINNGPVYSTGTWTPQLTFGGAHVGMTQITVSGSWICIGKFVIAGGHFALTDKGTSVGTAWIEGLPFASFSRFLSAQISTDTVGGAFPSRALSTIVCTMTNTPPCIKLRAVLNANGNGSDLTNADFAGTEDLDVQAIYIIP